MKVTNIIIQFYTLQILNMKRTSFILSGLLLLVSATKAQAVLGQTKPSNTVMTDAKTAPNTKKFKKINTSYLSKGNIKLKAGVIPAKDGKINSTSDK